MFGIGKGSLLRKKLLNRKGPKTAKCASYLY